MSKNIVTPCTVSFEEALRNLASRVTGTPVAKLPRSQEAIVQYMAEHIPAPSPGSLDQNELAEAVTQEVMARLAKAEESAPGSGRRPKPKPKTDAEQKG